MTTDISTFFTELEAGVFGQKLSAAISDCAIAAVDKGAPSKVVIEIDIKQVGRSDQVNVSHKMKYKRPTSRGEIAETTTGTTPMYVGELGAVTLFPENQGQMFDKHGTSSSPTKHIYPITEPING